MPVSLTEIEPFDPEKHDLSYFEGEWNILIEGDFVGTMEFDTNGKGRFSLNYEWEHLHMREGGLECVGISGFWPSCPAHAEMMNQAVHFTWSATNFKGILFGGDGEVHEGGIDGSRISGSFDVSGASTESTMYFEGWNAMRRHESLKRDWTFRPSFKITDSIYFHSGSLKIRRDKVSGCWWGMGRDEPLFIWPNRGGIEKASDVAFTYHVHSNSDDTEYRHAAMDEYSRKWSRPSLHDSYFHLGASGLFSNGSYCLIYFGAFGLEPPVVVTIDKAGRVTGVGIYDPMETDVPAFELEAVSKYLAEKIERRTRTGLRYTYLGGYVPPLIDPQARAGDLVAVHYVGFLKGGIKFDDSRDRGKPIVFRVGRAEVVAGWDEAVLGMAIGQRKKLLIPPRLGYGERGAGGSIPPNSYLIMEVELVGIKGVLLSSLRRAPASYTEFPWE